MVIHIVRVGKPRRGLSRRMSDEAREGQSGRQSRVLRVTLLAPELWRLLGVSWTQVDPAVRILTVRAASRSMLALEPDVGFLA